MTEISRRDLTRDVNARLRAGEVTEALRGLVALIRSAPHDLDARLRLADGLLAAGQVAAAAETYTFVAQEAARAGHPLKACVALKVLSALDPAVKQVFASLAERYAEGAVTPGRGARVTPPSPDAPVPAAAWLPESVTGPTLLDAARRVAVGTEGLPPAPAAVPPMPLFSELPREAFVRMMLAADLVRVPAGAVLLREGEPAESFFLLARGVLAVTRDEGRTVLARPGEGVVIGEMALLSNAPRMATVTATEDADLLVFGREAIAAARADVGALAAALGRFVERRVLSNLLATHPIFKPFDEAQRVTLAAHFETVKAPAETTLIRQGEAGRGLFVILTGEAQVTARDDAGTDHPVARLRSAEVFGEIALLRGTPTTATVTAARDATLLFLARDLFTRLVAGVPALREYFESLADHRFHDTSLALSGGEDVDLLL